MSYQYTNSQGEKIGFVRSEKQSCWCLVIYDDAPPVGTGKAAPMMLDAGTAEWLRSMLDMHFAKEEVQP